MADCCSPLWSCWWKVRTHDLLCIVNCADDLVTPGARASWAMIFFQYIPVSAPEVLISLSVTFYLVSPGRQRHRSLAHEKPPHPIHCQAWIDLSPSHSCHIYPRCLKNSPKQIHCHNTLLYPPYPKDRGMLWFYVEAARRPSPAARHPPPAMVLTR